MNRQSYHIAQLNIARMREPLDHPLMADFVAALDRINQLADRSPGFVWRLQSEEGNATDYRPYEDERILVNMSVWESIASLHQYVYRSEHAQFIAQRKKWFEMPTTPIQVLWWVPAGHIPTAEEAKARLSLLTEEGVTAQAFTFKSTFSPPST